MLERLHRIVNISVMPFWLLMLFAPNWRWTRRIVSSPWVATTPSIIYVIFIARGILFDEGEGDLRDLANPTPEAIAKLLGNPHGAATGWAHFLAFDLLVGRQIYLDSQARKLPHWVVAPALVFTFMLGPVGFLMYTLIGLFARGKK